jgi:hypothetical protein
LSGFGYPSTPAPYALNVISKILAFIAALTLFLPQRAALGQAPQPGRDERARVASQPPVIPHQRSPRSRRSAASQPVLWSISELASRIDGERGSCDHCE